MKVMTMDELYKALLAADNKRNSPKEEWLFDEEVVKVLGYYPDWYNMTVH